MYFNYGGKNYRFEGGDVIYEDVNHDGQIDELDIVYLGSSNPKSMVVSVSTSATASGR